MNSYINNSDIRKCLQDYLPIKDSFILSKTNHDFNNDFNMRIKKYFNCNIGNKKKELELIKYLTYLYDNSPESVIYYHNNKNKCTGVDTEICEYCTTLLNIDITKNIWVYKPICTWKRLKMYQMCVTESIRRKCMLRKHPLFKKKCLRIYDSCLQCNHIHTLWSPKKKRCTRGTNYYLPIYNSPGHKKLTGIKYLFYSIFNQNYRSSNIHICPECFKFATKLYNNKFKNRYPVRNYKLKKKDKEYITDDNDELTNITVSDYLSNGNSVIEWDF